MQNNFISHQHRSTSRCLVSTPRCPPVAPLEKEGDNGNFMQLARVEENKVFVNGEKQVLERFSEKDGHSAGRFCLGGLEYWCQQEFLVFPNLLGGGILEHSLPSSCSCHIPQT